MTSLSPVFIHSLFRSGSTYLFDVFRRSARGYWCYQEPLHENAFWFREEPERLSSELGSEKRSHLRHPAALRPYYQELQETWPAWKDSITAEAIYDGYFADPDTDIGIPYFRSLIEAAKGRPVFQECRTSGRIGEIRRQLNGFHIYLWRNAWDQWWSYKVGPYFDLVNQIILTAPGRPPEVELLLDATGLGERDQTGLAESFARFSDSPGTSEKSYLGHYMLWCIGLREGSRHAHLLLNIDRLSDSNNHREEICATLASAGIEGIDFHDCQVPQSTYSEQEKILFRQLENQVHQWLIEGGWSEAELENILSIRQKFEPEIWKEPENKLNGNFLAEQASRARALSMRYETTLAETTANCKFLNTNLESELNRSHERAVQAELNTAQAQALAEQSATQLKAQVEAKGAMADFLEMQLQAVYNSFSWKITSPLRLIFNLVRNLFSLIGEVIMFLLRIPKKVAQGLIKTSMLFALKSSRVEKLAMGFLIKHPTLHSHLRAFANTHQVLADNQREHPSTKSEKLTLVGKQQRAATDAAIPEIDVFSSEITPPLTADEIMTRLGRELVADEV